MPNHFHDLIIINDEITTVGATLVVAHYVDEPRDRAGTRPAPTVGEIAGAFKFVTTHEYILGLHTQTWAPFFKRLWQRNYYGHIIRNQDDLENTYNYINANPTLWEKDEENPAIASR